MRKHPGEAEAIRLRRAGKSREEIAAKLGVTENAVHAWTYLARPASERTEKQTALCREITARWQRRHAEGWSK